MVFLYRCADGHETELEFPMGQAPQSPGLCLYTPAPDEVLACIKPLVRVFTVPYIVHGPGFLSVAPWAGKIQKSKEAQDRFGKGEL